MSKPESFTTWTIEGRFFSDDRTLAIIAEFGHVSAYLILDTWNALYAAKSHRLAKILWYGKAKAFGFEREAAERLLTALCDPDIEYLLTDESGIGSAAVDEKCVKRGAEREAWRNKKRGGREKTDSGDSPDGFQGDSPEKGEGVLSSSPGERPTPTPTLTPTPTDLEIKNNGLVRLAEFVYIGEPQHEALKKRFRDEGLTQKDLDRAIEYYDRDLTNNPEKRKIGCHYKDIQSWPLKQVKKENTELARSNGKFTPKPEATIRRTRETYKEPTPDEKRPRTDEQRKRDEQILKEKFPNLKIKEVA